jgi:hypothetical protein
MGVRRRRLTADERNEALARKWAKQFVDYCTAQGWWLTSHSILNDQSEVLYDLDRPSAGFDYLFVWVTGSWSEHPLPRSDKRDTAEDKLDALFAEGDIVLPGGEA